MRITVIQLVMLVVFASVSFAHNLDAQALLDKKISFKVENRPIKNILNKIEKLSNANFSYESSLFTNNEKITINVDNESVSSILKRILAPYHISFEAFNDKRIILSKEFNMSSLFDVENNHFFSSISISGKVIDENGNPVPGVNILEKGTTNGSATDLNGNFTIIVENTNSILVFSFIGYNTVEQVVGNNSNLSIQLKADIKNLNEVVVIGYGTREKKDLITSVSEIKSVDIGKTITLTPETAMQGRMPGVLVSNGGGDPNSRPNVRIRGITTFNGNANPLYVIDGLPVYEYGQGATFAVSGDRAGDVRGGQNVLNLINPNDIESISVLKDASSAAIYGARGANGVVLITTKRGKEGKPKITFSASRGIQNIRKKINVLNTQEYTKLYQDEFANNNSLDTSNNDNKNKFLNFFNPSNSSYLGNSPTYNWQDEIINKNAVIENYNVGISGGTQFSNYSISTAYSRQESPLKFNYQERFSFSANTDFKFKKWLEVGESFRLAYTNNNDNRYTTGDLTLAFAPAWQPLYSSTTKDGFAPVTQAKYGSEAKSNFLALAKYNNNKEGVLRTLGNAYFTLIPFAGLRIKGSLSIDYVNNKRTQWALGKQAAYNYLYGDNGNVYDERHANTVNINKELTINYNKSFGNHNFDILLLAYDQQINFNIIGDRVIKIPFDDPQRFTVAGDATNIQSSSFREPKGQIGYAARLSYKFSDTYYLDASVMRNGSSNFIDTYRWGYFPSVSAGWRISNEKFMKNIAFISDLKLRGGIGTLGNQDIRSFAYLPTVSRNPQYNTGNTSNGSGIPNTAAILGDYANPNLKWETIITQNVGFDASFINNALTFSFEYYNRKTSDILQPVQLPYTTGITTTPVFNVASARNRGIEISIGYKGSVSDFRYNISGNITTVSNSVISTYSNQPLGDGSLGLRVAEGYSINHIWGYKTDGIFKNQEEVDAWKSAHPGSDFTTQLSPGDIRFKDLYDQPNGKGKPDGKVTNFDQTYLGKTIPGYYYGLNLGGNYKSFDLSILFQGIGDVQKINTLRQRGEYMGGIGNNQLSTTLNRWTPTNPNTSIPRAVYGDPSSNNRFSDRFVENAGFFRVSNVQFGYTLPKEKLSKLGILDNLRIYLQGGNCLVITKYKGLDPENDNNPIPRTFLLGLNASF